MLLAPTLGLHRGAGPATSISKLFPCEAEPGADESIVYIDWSNEHQNTWMAGVGEQGHCERDAHEIIAEWLEQVLGRKALGPCTEPVFDIKPSLGKL